MEPVGDAAAVWATATEISATVAALHPMGTAAVAEPPWKGVMMKRICQWPVMVGMTAVVLLLLLLVPVLAAAVPTNVRLSNDAPGTGGYISAYTLATGIPYTDAVLSEASMARGRQNEPAVEIDPRDPRVIIGSSNDYAGVYAGSTPGNFVPAGPIWLGYYRSENGGASFVSSLVPGYPGDTSPYAALAQIRTASSGDPVIAWDKHGRVFMGSESSDDPAGSLKTFGDEWVATYREPRRGQRQHAQRRQAVRALRDRGQGFLGAKPPRQVQRQDGHRGGPHDELARGQRLLLVVALHRQAATWASTSPAPPTTARLGRSR